MGSERHPLYTLNNQGSPFFQDAHRHDFHGSLEGAWSSLKNTLNSIIWVSRLHTPKLGHKKKRGNKSPGESTDLHHSTRIIFSFHAFDKKIAIEKKMKNLNPSLSRTQSLKKQNRYQIRYSTKNGSQIRYLNNLQLSGTQKKKQLPSENLSPRYQTLKRRLWAQQPLHMQPIGLGRFGKSSPKQIVSIPSGKLT